ncbi:DUF4388 domain-containing protein [Desulfobacula toluolica]|uniref:Conserved uncharacterized protein n=1 Tax=Desulfobacula toluolica (strain DSM 7467 / Tol2) TaxID=651182 RepID=K0NI22_DESTT|nr:DUF4388 domain-containing protein [Desulfobacula toluolica]CCK80570.1 conserved uncharacterized protein [Desulfobacula toluolica Tol2]
MNLQGDFEGLTLASILQLLCNDQKTGVLTVTCDDEESRVFFEQGTIIYASASFKEARLGSLMRNDGIISAKQLQKCFALARQEKMHLGKILVEKGYISVDTLKKYNTRQVEAILYNLLFWKKGRFEYKDTRLNLKGMIVTQLNPMKLILEASRRIDELSVLKEFIPSDKMVFKMSGKVQSKDEIKLNANEWRVLSLIDGTRSVRQIITESGYDEFAVYKIFFSVISSGLIEQKEEIQLDDQGGEKDFSAILTVFNDILQSISKNIADELGDRSYSLFEEIKPGLAIEFKDVFREYHPDKHKNSNFQAITNALDQMKFIEDPKGFLILGFTEYCTQLLKKAGQILGSQPLIKILNDIENVLGYVKKYQAGSKEKSKIVNNMKNVIVQLSSEFKTDKKSGSKRGIFSFFS